MKIVVTGKEGQVDTSLQMLADATPGVAVLRLGLPEIDLSRPATLEAAIRAAAPDVIVSSAAYTAVDKAESEPELAQRINGDGPGELARIARRLDVPIIHLSTDYVFAGDKLGVYDEDDAPAPDSVYGSSKLSGERQVAAGAADHVILRTAWVYSPYGHNFVRTMLRLAETRDEVAVVADQHGCPTYAPEIARAVLAVAHRLRADSDPGLRGLFHLTGQGETTWAAFAEAIFAAQGRRGGPSATVRPITTADYPTAARRPANSRLSGVKLKHTYGLQLDPWRVSLEHCLDALAHAAAS